MNIATMCRLFLTEQRQLSLSGDSNALAPRTIEDYTEALERHIIPTFGLMRVNVFKPTHAAQYLF